jgi:FAD/FMN-containing dehydrogenase
LTIDSLLAAELVTADGEVMQVDADNHPDLFWAIRGGGGNFGVVTRFHFRPAPDELSTIVNVMKAPPMPFLPPEVHGKLIVMALMAYAGDAEAGNRALAPFRALATPIADMLRPMRYPDLYGPEPEDYHPLSVGRNLFVSDVTVDRAAHILQRIQGSTAMMSATQLRVLGGAISRVPAAETAYAHRDRRIMANVAAIFTNPADAALHEEWVVGLAAELKDGTEGAYVNFLNGDGDDRLGEAYPGSTLDRLRSVKRRYDPDNLFRLNQNITPA